jgi:hypothetical protein
LLHLFSVKENYEFLSSWLAASSPLSTYTCGVVHKVWDSLAPSKVVVFSWQTLLSRVLTKANLVTRGVVLEDVHLLCALVVEVLRPKTICSFLLCHWAWCNWIEVYRWFGVVEVFLGNICSHFEGFFSSLKRGKKSSKGILMVWNAVLWILWRARIDKKKSGNPIHLEDVLERIKCTSWKWLLARKPNSHCLYY